MTTQASSSDTVRGAVVEKIDPTVEESYWREAYRDEPYYTKEHTYEDYAPAYRVGYEGIVPNSAQPFEDAEARLQSAYGEQRGGSKLSWENAKHATRAAWERAKSGFQRQ